ncbi:glycoside hydrolase family 5 protein [Paludisphaera soli]|uniref:glycoside hydrolase family 5 protein n=1 Tax=Paludisphaera soli TaxID=2712865 RepID=UPI0013EB996E|nr:glycoside hydrolase family 5 protein [Paludisphaera soli]
MRTSIVATLSALLAASALAPARADGPIKLLAENPRYFEFRGEPTLLITSGEHYGAVLNLDFDQRAYLDELQRHGLNNTRTFAGTYRETPGSFNIRDNTLAPKPGRFASPWLLVSKPGEPEKFDLDRYDDAYFERLKQFLTLAAERGVVVEYDLFCVLYDDGLWAINPMNAANNVNGEGKCPRGEVLTLQHDDLTARQVALVKKTVAELNEFDNLYYEICNEPYFGANAEWQAQIAATIVEAERALPKKHLISQNFANDKGKVENPDPNVSFYNFHYAVPEAVTMNAHLDRPIGDNETGFKGNDDRVYRTQAWRFLMAGGALFNNLDYSFTAAHPDGTAEVTPPTPGGGGPAFRKQMSVLAGILREAQVWKMGPAREVLGGAKLFKGSHLDILARPGAVLAYVDQGPGFGLTLNLPPASYAYRWIDPITGDVLAQGELDFDGAVTGAQFVSPAFAEDVVLILLAK